MGAFNPLLWFVSGLLWWGIYTVAHGQEHEHGVNNLPTWYDANCCNLQDCRPVPDDDIAFQLDEFGAPVILHRPTNLIFTRERWRTSQDERMHVCFRGTAAPFTAYCVYLRAGA